MAELKKLLTALIKGQGSFEQVNAAVGQYLAQSPDKAPQVAKLLKAARDAGLPHNLYVSLSGNVPSTATEGSDEDPTILASDDAYAAAERTVLATDGDYHDAEKTTLAADGGEDTVVPKDIHDDKTVVDTSRRDEEKTEALKSSAESPEETTEMDAVLDDDATAVNINVPPEAGSEYSDATEINPASAETTDASASTTEETFDVITGRVGTAAEKSAEQPTGASWPTSVPVKHEDGAGVTRTFQEGDLLRNRFELISKLGEGGMGAVWKGKDLLKEEARDRNPYVAIKLLQGDFKEHPEAFIALQRETAKQQRLAHPNVATVFDFDRDDSSNTVFMTMEVLEGQPLDSYIRKLPGGGLLAEEALPLIEQLCNGLAYAHSYGLVHSDLKPGNCFFTKDGTIKLLDFGIARASKTKTDAEGETTLFDPRQLGALTPTYATLEMFEGQDPDPRDDIYALAIMSYQLLTGKHPYGKKSAPKAKKLGLRPEPVTKLSKRQNKGLMRGLAFERDARTPTVEEFFESIRPKKSRAPMIIAASLAAVIIIAAGAYNPIVDFFNKYRRDEIISVIQRPGIENIRQGLEQAAALGDPEQLSLVLNDPRTKDAIVTYLITGGERTINETLSLMAPYDKNWQRDVKEVERAKAAIMDLYQSKISEAFNLNQERYDFATASEQVAKLDDLYPDSAQVLQIKTQLNQDRAMKLADLSEEYSRFLDEGRLLPTQTGSDIGDVINVVKQIDPEHALLKDDRLRFRYGELVEQAIDEKAYTRADALLKASLAYAPEDPKLNDLRFRVEAELQRIANERRVAEIEQRLGQQVASLNSLADFQQVRDDLIVLADLSPESNLLQRIQGSLKQAFTTELNKNVSQKDWPAGEQLLVAFAKLFDIPYLTQQRKLLSAAEDRAGYAVEMTPQRQAVVDDRVKNINALLASPEFSTDWEIRLKVPYKELIALLPLGDATFDEVRNQTARLYLQKAKSALDAERFVEALAFIDRGRVFYPGLKNFNDFEQAIARAQEDWRKRREEEQRLARIEAYKNQFRAAAERNDVRDANEKIAAIKAEGLAADDPFLTEEAPRDIASAYLRLAEGRVEGERPDYEQALALSRKGLEVAPDLEPLKLAAMRYETEVKKRELEISLRKVFDSTGDIDVPGAKAGLEKLRTDFPNRYAGLRKEFAEARGNQIRAMANSKDLKIALLGQRTAEYKELFPNEAATVQDDVASIVAKRIMAARVSSAKDLESLSGTLGEFRAFSPQGYASLSRDMSKELAGQIRSLEKKDKFAAADLLTASKRQFGEGAFKGIDIELPLKEIADGMKLVSSGRLTAAQGQLAAAKKKDPGHSDLPALETALQSSMAKASDAYDKYAKAASASRTTRDQPKFDAYYNQEVLALWSDNPKFARIQIAPPRRGECGLQLAGYGRRRAGECWDLMGRAKGPLMVVVPAGGSVGQPFAISKYEISGNDYNDYCKATGRCNALRGSKAKLPLTSISVQDAEAFAKWLSDEASKTEKRKVVYRLPTEAEWEHAASAGGAQPEKKYNCRVTSGGNIISGHALVDAASGAQNGWGLANYVGNAQEWVRAGGGLKARGGAYEDPLTRCDISISRGHNGQPDGVTGFRLVREMG